MKFCSSCGQMLDDHDMFCDSCGARQSADDIDAAPAQAATQMFVPPSVGGDTRVVEPPTQVVPTVSLEQTPAMPPRKKSLSTPLLVLIVAAIATVVLTLIVLTIVLLTSGGRGDKAPAANGSVPSAAVVEQVLCDDTQKLLSGIFLRNQPASSDMLGYIDIVNAVNDYAEAVGAAKVSTVDQRRDDTQNADIYTFVFDNGAATVEIVTQEDSVMQVATSVSRYNAGLQVEYDNVLLIGLVDAVAPLVPASRPQSDYYTNLTWHVNSISTNYRILSDDSAAASYSSSAWDFSYTYNPVLITLTATHEDFDPAATTTTTTTTTTTAATTTTTAPTQPLLVLPSAAQQHGAVLYDVQSADGYVNMRYGPSLDHAVVTTVPSGTRLSVTASDGGWFYTEYNGMRGWVHNLELKAVVSAPQLVIPNTYLPETAEYYVITSDGANLRYGPATSYALIGNISEGNVVEVVSVQGDWCFACFNGTSGWLHMSSLSELQPGAPI